MIDAQIRTQKKICLAGFNRDAHRRPAAVEIPGIQKNIMLRHHPTGAHGSFFALNRNDPVNQHEGLIRQTNPDVVGVHRLKFRTQHLCNRAHGELHAHVPVKDRFNGLLCCFSLVLSWQAILGLQTIVCNQGFKKPGLGCKGFFKASGELI